LQILTVLSAVQNLTRNFFFSRVRRSCEFIFWGHLGLGDQIMCARLLEHWSQRSHIVHIPCKSRNFDVLSEMYSYLRHIVFHPIPDDPNLELQSIERLGVQLNLPTLMAGRHVLDLVQRLFPSDGLNTNLNRTAGFKIDSFFSPRFRANVLTKAQLQTPPHPYAFVNRRNSLMTMELPMSGPWDSSLVIVEEREAVPIYSYAQTIISANELRSVGSSFMCLAMVIGSNAKSRFFISKTNLMTDDPKNEWTQVLP
jgi:hypothetical protein